MQNLTDNVKTLVNNNNPSPQITLQVDSLMKDVTITKDVDADSLLVKMKDGLLNIVTKELSKSMNLKFGW